VGEFIQQKNPTACCSLNKPMDDITKYWDKVQYDSDDLGALNFTQRKCHLSQVSNFTISWSWMLMEKTGDQCSGMQGLF
jgi:hypothetical protein